MTGVLSSRIGSYCPASALSKWGLSGPAGGSNTGGSLTSTCVRKGTDPVRR